MKKSYLILNILLIIIGTILVFTYLLNRTHKNTVTVDGHVFNVERAVTATEREKGLMNRTSLDANAGMLFVFSKSDIQTFWMKNTLIPLDIIYINNGKIVDITTLSPQSENNIPQYTPKEKANYVLELNAGTAKKDNFKIGGEVKIN